jgi:hypothetical protein
VCKITLEKGIDEWWRMSPEDLIGEELINKLDLIPGQIFKGMVII